MKAFLARLVQPSSWAGYSALIYSVPAILVNPADLTAWAATFAAIAAVLKQEQAMKVLKGENAAPAST